MTSFKINNLRLYFKGLRFVFEVIKWKRRPIGKHDTFGFRTTALAV
jgi:hypothetical protein